MIIIVTKRKLILKTILVAILCLVAYKTPLFHEETIPTSSVNSNEKSYVAIIIDDFGYSGEGTNEMLALNIPITAAIMPFSDKTAQDSAAVIAAGKEAIIHMPMESLTGKKEWVGDKAVTTTMTDDEIKNRVLEGLNAVPNAVGINNHMGSKIMEDERSISAVIEEAAEKGLIFIDSKTTPNSKAKSACMEKGVPYLYRDVFLDSTNDINVVKKQLLKAGDIAIKKGTAIAIGHVGPEGGKITAQAIKELAPELQKKGVEFVTVSQLKQIVEVKQAQQLRSGKILEE